MRKKIQHTVLQAIAANLLILSSLIISIWYTLKNQPSIQEQTNSTVMIQKPHQDTTTIHLMLRHDHRLFKAALK